ncbi:MAG TPA: hypothetical protein VGP72_04030 [Planctomycetota bacterium]|jgi:uncharacterized membrane protein HdeD (DUF308 family)
MVIKATLLLAIWLVLFGLMQLFALHFAGDHIVMGILALVAGVLFLMDRPWR